MNVLLAYFRHTTIHHRFRFKSMKKIAAVLFISLLIFACNNKSNNPDVSGIKVDAKAARFEDSFFSIDTNNIAPGLLKVRTAFPDFYPDFMQNLLGVSGTETDTATLDVTHKFISSYSSLYTIIKNKYKDFSGTENDIKHGLQYVKYYFPQYKIPKLITFIGTLDAPGVALTTNHIAIGLQQFAGKNFEGYFTADVQQAYPDYIVRRFDKEYIPVSVIKAVVLDLFGDNTTGKPLIEQMIEKGKQWWLLDKFMPETSDTLKTGYTKKQLDWCVKNEGEIWSYIKANENLESVDPETIQNYIGEAPFTQGMPESGSPGNLGPWVGWQIIKKYVSKTGNENLEQLMKTPARVILESSKYNPK